MDKTLVIIINYNSAVHTKECVESFARQTRQDFDLMVIDNASNPDDVDLLDRIESARLTVVKSKSNLGFSGGNNIGLKYALEKKYARALLINNDTTVPEDFMAKTGGIFQAQSWCRDFPPNSRLLQSRSHFVRRRGRLFFQGWGQYLRCRGKG